jgi:hemerythrin superfamily protein
MDAIELLISDHRKVDGLFQQFEKGGNTEEFTQLFTTLKEELTVHSKIEEEIFYPAVRNNPDTANLVAEAYQEHAAVKALLDQIDGMDNTSTEWGQKMTENMRDVQAHVQMEEGEMFPRVREYFQADQLQQLGQQLEQRKAELKGQSVATEAPAAQATYQESQASYQAQAPQDTTASSGQLGALDATSDMNQPSDRM